jgi:hypothetical protein
MPPSEPAIALALRLVAPGSAGGCSANTHSSVRQHRHSIPMNSVEAIPDEAVDNVSTIRTSIIEYVFYIHFTIASIRCQYTLSILLRVHWMRK